MVTCMDEAIGNITRTMEEAGLWDNTVFIFSTGEGEKRCLGKNTL